MTSTATWLNVILASLCACTERSIDTAEHAESSPPELSAQNDLRGQVVTIRGPIEGVFGGRAFAVEARESEVATDQKEILVVAQAAIRLTDQPLVRRDDVIVRGKLRKFERAALHQEIGWNPISLESDYDEQMVVVADSVTMAEEPLLFWTKPLAGY